MKGLYNTREEATMDDNKIIDLYWERSELAISETANKYERYCYSISYNILHSEEAAEECVNDTYLSAWKSMPPHRPSRLATFLGKITRNLSLNSFKQYKAEKRGLGQTALALSEFCLLYTSNIKISFFYLLYFKRHGKSNECNKLNICLLYTSRCV